MTAVRAAGPRKRGLRLPLLRLGGAGRVWLLNLGLSVAAGLVLWRLVLPLPQTSEGLRIPWWGLAAAFALTETFVVHFQLRREAHSFSLSDVPLVLGLFFVSPVGVVAAQVAGATIALAMRRQSPMKLVFNLAQFALTAGLAVAVFHWIALQGPPGLPGFAGAFLATATTTVIGAFAITAAISLAEGRTQLETMRQGLGFGIVVAFTDTCLALVAVETLWRDPAGVWLLAIPAMLMFLAYRMYTTQRQRHATLEVLFDASRRLQRSLQVEETMRGLLEEARKMLRAEIACVTMLPSGKGSRALRTTLGPGEGPEHTEPIDLDPREGVWARVASEGQAILLPRPIENERLREHFSRRGLRDAMVAPLLGEHGVVGTLLVGNRLGAVSSFDRTDLQLFEALTNHASVALQNSQLVDRLEDSLAHVTEMNRLKDDFVATVSHELRTPLTSIQGSIKTILRLDLPDEDRRALLEAADRGGDRLRHLIEDLLMASRIESREVRPVVHHVSPPDVIRTVAEEVEFERAGRRLEIVLAEDLPLIETDEGKVTQIVSNLLGNAAKYSDEDSTVTLEARMVDDGLLVWVSNRGEPIPKAQHERIFDRFFQVDQTSTRLFGGAGLGLYICRKLSEAIGGRVWLERSDDQATVFGLFIPSTPPQNAIREPEILPEPEIALEPGTP